MRRIAVPVIVSLVGSLALFGTIMVSPAAATHVGCASVITTNTVLDSDVGPCVSGGITVGADNVTLDLNGHRVFGLPAAPGDGAGISIPNHTGVVVKNGTVTDFDAGVAIVGGSANTVTGITARDNISLLGLGDFGDGIAISSSSNNLITNNVVDHNGPFDGIGLFGNSSGNTIQDNVVTNNNIASGPNTNQDDGIRLEPGTSNNTITGNTVARSGLDGVALFANSPSNTVTSNSVNANGFHDKTHRKGDGVRAFLTANNGLIQSNGVFNNAASGIRIDSQSNQILSNQTGGNDAAPDVSIQVLDLVVVNVGLRVVLVVNGNPVVDTHIPPRTAAYDLYDTNAGCDNNVWSGNTYGTAFPSCTTV